jgi:hypothetical protein
MAEVKAIKILVDSLTFGGTVYAAGQVVLDATEEMLACADSKRTNDAGKLLCKRLAKQDALKAAKRFVGGCSIGAGTYRHRSGRGTGSCERQRSRR